jgi:hypothetical protein
MRFERLAAYSVGALLPIAEICRRRTDFSDIPAYADDFLIGGLLLFAAWFSSNRSAAGRVLLAVAWGVFCGGMYYAFVGQLANRGHLDVSGLSNGVLVAVKGVLFVVGIAAVIRSTQASIREGRL